MSTRLGMGDGRCLTSFDSSKLVNDFIMMKTVSYTHLTLPTNREV